MNIPITHFIKLSDNYLELVRQWRNSPRVNSNMLTTDEISSRQQIDWFKKNNIDKTKRYFVFLQNDRPIGMLYFTDITNESCVWGCYIGDESIWPGSGILLEVAALDFAFKYLNVHELVAEVLEFNKAPQKLHMTFGYEFIGSVENVVKRDGKLWALNKYIYKRESWESNRNSILLKLPKQIRAASEKIYFQDDEQNLPE